MDLWKRKSVNFILSDLSIGNGGSSSGVRRGELLPWRIRLSHRSARSLMISIRIRTGYQFFFRIYYSVRNVKFSLLVYNGLYE